MGFPARGSENGNTEYAKSRSSLGIDVLNSGSVAFRWDWADADDPQGPGFTEILPTRIVGAIAASSASSGPEPCNSPLFMVIGRWIA